MEEKFALWYGRPCTYLRWEATTCPFPEGTSPQEVHDISPKCRVTWQPKFGPGRPKNEENTNKKIGKILCSILHIVSKYYKQLSGEFEKRLFIKIDAVAVS